MNEIKEEVEMEKSPFDVGIKLVKVCYIYISDEANDTLFYTYFLTPKKKDFV